MTDHEPAPSAPGMPDSLLADFFPESDSKRELNLSPRTVARMRAEGRGPPWRMIGSRVYIHRPSAKEWLLSGLKHPVRSIPKPRAEPLLHRGPGGRRKRLPEAAE